MTKKRIAHKVDTGILVTANGYTTKARVVPANSTCKIRIITNWVAHNMT